MDDREIKALEMNRSFHARGRFRGPAGAELLWLTLSHNQTFQTMEIHGKHFILAKNDSYLFLQDQATYTCDEGFTIVGVATVTCQASGRWSGEPANTRVIIERVQNLPTD